MKLQGHTEAITCMLPLSEPESILLTGSEDGTVRVWAMSSVLRALVSTTLRLSSEAVCALEADTDALGIVYAACGCRIYVLALTAGQLSVLHSHTFNGDDITSLAFRTGHLAASDDDGCISLSDCSHPRASGLRLIRMMRKGHSNICSGVLWPCGSSSLQLPLISGGMDCSIVLWSGHTGTPVICLHATGALRMHAHALAADKDVQIDEAEPTPNGRISGESAPPSGAGGGARGAAAAKLRARLAAGSAGPPRLGFEAGALLSPSSLPSGLGGGGGQMLNPPFVHALVSSPCGKFIVSAHGDGAVCVWAWDSCPERGGPRWFLQPVWVHSAHGTAATCLAFVPLSLPTLAVERGDVEGEREGGMDQDQHAHRGYVLISCGNDKVVCLWRWSNGTEMEGEGRERDTVLGQAHTRAVLLAAAANINIDKDEAESREGVSLRGAHARPSVRTEPAARVRSKRSINCIAGMCVKSRGPDADTSESQKQWPEAIPLLLVGDVGNDVGVHNIKDLLGTL